MKTLGHFAETFVCVFLALVLVVHAHKFAVVVAVLGTLVVFGIAAVDLYGRLGRRSGGAR
ncbi:hypothetical protein GCM10028801_36080 [Nocardioides maradonensis]